MSQASAKIRTWREDPVTFVRENFQVEPDPWQVGALRAFPKHNRIAGKACKGPGKTALEAWLGWNFLATRPHCKVPCTSITGVNLKDGLWAEFEKWRQKSKFLQETFEWTSTRIFAKSSPHTWFASARTWQRDADPQALASTLAGIHADYVLFLIDEVGDIPDAVVAAAEGALTSGKETKIVMMGNATRTDGPLYRACTVDRRFYFIVEITGDPDDPNRSPRIDIEEARRQIDKYGRDSYTVRVNILGQFPMRQADKLIGPEDVAAAMARVLRPEDFDRLGKALGVDVARFGNDDATLSPRQGRMAWQIRTFRDLDNVELAEQVLRFHDRWKAGRIFIDGGGNGAGVVDVCKHRGYAHVVEEVNFGARATDDARFENKRAEMYWEAAELVRNGGCLPNDPLLAEELCAPIYWFDKKQRICLEGKDEIKKRIGRSPDRADGYVLTFAGHVAAERQVNELPWDFGNGETRSSHEPFSSYDDRKRERPVALDPLLRRN